jgi:hypothetical protein
MTATNVIPDGMKNEASSAALVAVAEAVEWKRAFEPSGEKRKGQQVVIYPPTLDKPEAVSASGDFGLDSEPSHSIVYQRILAASATFEHLPAFFSGSSHTFGGLPIADKVPQWMHTAKEISIGGRGQVLEDGNDVCNSESDSENEEHGDELTGCYKGIPVDDQGNPLSAAYKLSPGQAAALRWEAQQSKGFTASTIQAFAAGFCKPPYNPRLKRRGRQPR